MGLNMGGERNEGCLKGFQLRKLEEMRLLFREGVTGEKQGFEGGIRSLVLDADLVIHRRRLHLAVQGVVASKG